MSNAIVRQEFEYYLAHQDELVTQYNGKVLLIVNHAVVGTYETEAEAYLDAIRRYHLGTFLIQRCSPGPDAYTIKYHSHVRFAE